ncbi:hypothetical protein KFK09_020470 [Dendrobium nobile]|uniref:PX domain-containing protein n=1 Tax=Dendrobium nobile TaxID=94219 RepID=A0A8T3ALY8_DENNO|nr:hypothetical protein KFK09_020470 [Dendrobium nobile]
MMGPETASGFGPPLPSEVRASLPLSSSSSSSSSPSIYRSAVSGDPLLFPSSASFSSSSSFVDPPSYADAVFRPVEPQNGIDSTSGSATAFSRSGRASTSDYLEITVTDPQKENDSATSLVPGGGAYVTYLITTRVRVAATAYSVRRRFRDVVTLADRLAESYRGFFIPIRPDKNVVESQVMQKHEFVEQRRDALEKYLQRLATHPVVGCSEELRVFLRAQGKLPLSPTTDVASRMLDGAVRLPRQLFGDGAYGSVAPQEAVQPARGGRDLLRMFKELKQSVTNDWGGTKPLLVEEDKEFLERKGKIQELALQLNATSEQDTLHEYMGLMLSIRNAFSERSDALLTVQTLLSDLTSLHARAEKLEAASARVFGRDDSRIQKLEEIRRTIKVTEDAKDCATREYEKIKENNRNELERFDSERQDDFLSMLRGLAINQAGYFEKIADVWGTVARETSHYAKENC